MHKGWVLMDWYFLRLFFIMPLLFQLSTIVLLCDAMVPPGANEKCRNISPQNSMILNYVTVAISTLSSFTVNILRSRII